MTELSQRFEATIMPDRDWWTALWPDPRAVLAELGLRPGMRGVDLGCGDGLFTVAMAGLCGPRQVAIDIDPAMIEAARAAVDAAGVPAVELRCADMLDAPALLDGPVDFALIANTFHGAPDKPGLARSVRAALGPGGRLIVINWWPRPREQTPVLGQPRGPRLELRFSPDQVAAWVEPAGFSLAEVVEVGPYHYAAVFEAC